MKAKLSVDKTNVDKYLKGLLKKQKTIPAFLERAIYPRYQTAQRDRWKSENSSEGRKWKSLNPGYAAYKRKKFASYPGAGKAMMVATGALYNAATGQGPGLSKIITDRQMVISIQKGVIPYAEYAGSVRPFMSFSKKRISEWKQIIVQYVMDDK